MPVRSGDYQSRKVIFDASSAASSTFTSQAHYVADYGIMTVELPIALNSGITLEGTNDEHV